MSAATVEGNTATLYAHDKRLTALERCQEQLMVKMDKQTWLIIATLVGVIVNMATRYWGF